jgi:hypothetical protein
VPVAMLAVVVVRAADHLDSPVATNDPAADIADVYAFTSPENATNLVLVMNVAPFGSASKFSNAVSYAFRIRNVTSTSPITLDTIPLDVVCTFDTSTPQHGRCAGPRNLAASFTVEDKSDAGGGAQSDMRVFAGKRSDPFFFDLAGFQSTVQAGKPAFTGTNTFDKANVLSIVVEINATKAFGLGAIVSVAGETVRGGS